MAQAPASTLCTLTAQPERALAAYRSLWLVPSPTISATDLPGAMELGKL